MPITSGTDIRWCERCQQRAATSFCEVWLCGPCYQATHRRDANGILFHGPRDEVLPVLVPARMRRLWK